MFDSRHASAPRRPGFTLIELLVVISIVAMLIALLLPALGKARFTAETTHCIARIRQMSLTVNLYTDAHNGYFPPMPSWGYNYGHWFTQLAPYAGHTHVTSNWRHERYSGMQCTGRVAGVYTYGYPYWLYSMPWSLFYTPTGGGWGNGTEVPQRVDNFKMPAKLGVALDAGHYATAIHPPQVDTFGIFGHPVQGIAQPNHEGRGMSTAFLDGHATFNSIERASYTPSQRRPPWWLKSFWQVPGSWGQNNGYRD